MLLIWDNSPEGSSIRQALPYLESYLTNCERHDHWDNVPLVREEILARGRRYVRKFLDAVKPYPDFHLEVHEDRIDLLVGGSAFASWRIPSMDQTPLPQQDDAPPDANMCRFLSALRAFIMVRATQGPLESMTRDEVIDTAISDPDEFVHMLEPCANFQLVISEDRVDLRVDEGVCATWRRRATIERVQQVFDSLAAEAENAGQEQHGYFAAKINVLSTLAARFEETIIANDGEKMWEALLAFMLDTCELIVRMQRLPVDNIAARFPYFLTPRSAYLRNMIVAFVEAQDEDDNLFAFIQETCGFFAPLGANAFLEDTAVQIMQEENPTDAQRHLLAFMRETCKLFSNMLRLLGDDP